MEYELWLLDIKQCNKLVQVTCGGVLMHFFPMQKISHYLYNNH